MARRPKHLASHSSRTQVPPAQLYALMQRLPSRMRQSMLAERFSQAQRLALERWIIAQKALENKRSRGGAPAARSSTKARPGRQPGRSGVSGLHLHRRKVGKSFYRASVVVGPFRLSTGFTTKLDKARDFLEVLLRVRSKVSDAKVCLASSLASKELEQLKVCFKTAVKEEMAQLGAAGRREMQLNFYAKVPANYWIGKALSTPHFSATDGGLEQGFEAWKSLTLARAAIFPGRTNRYTILQHHQPEDLEAAWGRLRQKHIDVWRAAGRCPTEAAARLAALEAKHHPYHERMQRRWMTAASRNSGITDDAGTQQAIESILAGWSPSPATAAVPKHSDCPKPDAFQ